MALMFFPDRAGALGKWPASPRPGGTVAVLVPSALDAQPAYGPFVDMAARHAGPEARSLLSTYFACGDARTSCRPCSSRPGCTSTVVTSHAGLSRFPSIDAACMPPRSRAPHSLSGSPRTSTSGFARRPTRCLLDSSPTKVNLKFPFESLVVVGRKRRRHESPLRPAPLAPPPPGEGGSGRVTARTLAQQRPLRSLCSFCSHSR